MTTSSANDPANLPGATLIVDLFPRRRLRHDINTILRALHTDKYVTSNTRRLIANATAIFGDEIVSELQRACEHDDHHCAAAIVALRIIATDTARAALWHVGRERRYGPLLQLDALRALCQLGEVVAVHELVALANRCESLAPHHGKDHH